MSLVSDVIYGALRLCRVRNTNSAILTEALDSLNLMLKSWEETMLTPTTESFTLTASTAGYTIGTGGTLDTAKPMSIKSAYIRDSDGVDYEVEVSMSPIDYNLVSDKDVDERANELYYDANYSSGLGCIYLNGAYSTAETLYLTSYKPITSYTAITDTITQPAEWEKAMRYNLAIDLAPEYGMALDPYILNEAARLRNIIECRNSSTPIAKFDSALLR